MSDKLSKLISIASTSVSNEMPVLGDPLEKMAGDIAEDLVSMLYKRNGFYAFENALHVFAIAGEKMKDEVSLQEWNSGALWRSEYGDLIDPQCLFFAEDVFGGQFCILNNKIYAFDPETAALEFISETLEGWAGMVLEDYNVLTGFSLAKEWQQLNGPITPGNRLIPKIPFVTGGEFGVGNLFESNAVEAMKMRGKIAIEIDDVPDGANIKINVVD